jgi:hypothetical protein
VYEFLEVHFDLAQQEIDFKISLEFFVLCDLIVESAEGVDG